MDREPGADRGRHGLLDDVGAARTRRDRRLLDRALLHAGDARRDADDHARLRQEATLVHLLDEVPEHLLGDVEVGDHAVLQRAHRLDVARRASDHALGLGAHRKDGSGKGVDRDDARLVEHDAAATHVHERVRGAEVDGHVATKEPEYTLRPLVPGRGGRRSLNPLGHDGIRKPFNRRGPELATSPGRNHAGVTSPPIGSAPWRRGGLPGAGLAVRRHGRPVGRPSRRAGSCSTRRAEAMGRDVVAGAHDEAALATTEFVQPALLACGVAAFRVLEAEGLAGVVGRRRALARRVLGPGRRRRAAPRGGAARGGRAWGGHAARRGGTPGTMTALLGTGPDDAEALCDEARGDDVLLVANRNSPVQSVISGSVPAIERAEALAAERKIRAVRLNVAGAFHSPLMEPAVQPILDELAALEFALPAFPIAENVSGTLVSGPRPAAVAARTSRDLARAMAGGRAGARRRGRRHVPGVRPRRRAHEDGQAGRAGRERGRRSARPRPPRPR